MSEHQEVEHTTIAVESWRCASCGMPMPAGPAVYHPHMYCVLWRQYGVDPEKVLRDHGFERRDG